MKPCRRFCKPIALHAAGALAAGEAPALRQHLAQCQPCREYFNSMQSVCRDHRQAALALSGADPLPEPLLRRVSERLEPSPKPRPSLRLLPLPRLAWSLAALAAAAFVWRQVAPPRDSDLQSTPRPPIAASAPNATASHMAYRLALNRSFEQLDLVLSKTAEPSAAPPVRSLYQSRLELAGSGY